MVSGYTVRQQNPIPGVFAETLTSSFKVISQTDPTKCHLFEEILAKIEKHKMSSSCIQEKKKSVVKLRSVLTVAGNMMN